MSTIKLRYKCACFTAERTLEVRVRTSGEDVVEWMEEVVRPALEVDHTKRSPNCHAVAMEYLKIPHPENAPGIGEAPKFDS